MQLNGPIPILVIEWPMSQLPIMNLQEKIGFLMSSGEKLCDLWAIYVYDKTTPLWLNNIT